MSQLYFDFNFRKYASRFYAKATVGRLCTTLSAVPKVYVPTTFFAKLLLKLNAYTIRQLFVLKLTLCVLHIKALPQNSNEFQLFMVH